MWSLDPNVIHLNHGSFGAAPLAVQSEQQRWRDRMEANPVRFMAEVYPPALETARAALAGFVGADPADLVFVRNATEGVNAVLRSLAPSWQPGDEIVVTNHGYAACTNAARAMAAERGARVVEARVPFPLTGPDDVVVAIEAACSERTVLLLIDHVTSPTGIVFPIERIVEAAGGAPVLVDGSHAPGMVPLDLAALDAAFYAGNCHKWLCAPKGAGFLVVAPGHQAGLFAPVISHSYGGDWQASTSAFHANFDWTGTDDFTARLSVPAALDTMAASHEQGWPGVMAGNRALALAGREILCSVLDLAPPVPDALLGSLATLRLAPHDGPPVPSDPLTAALRHEHGIEVPVYAVPGLGRIIRVSAQRYNRLDHYERLAVALKATL